MERYENFKDMNVRRAQDKTSEWLVPVLCVVLVVLMFFLGVLVGFRANFEYIPVRGTSMQDTLNPDPKADNGYLWQDGVIIEYKAPVHRGDVVVLWPDKEAAPKETIIKRVIATGGDRVTITEESVGVDESNNPISRFVVTIIEKDGYIEIPLEEDYVKQDFWLSDANKKTFDSVTYDKEFFGKFLNGGQESESVSLVGGKLYFQVPENQILFLGDHRAASKDARFYGTKNVDQVKGVVRVITRNSQNGKQTKPFVVFKYALSYFFGQFSEYFAWN